jgi:hypothetical protein
MEETMNEQYFIDIITQSGVSGYVIFKCVPDKQCAVSVGYAYSTLERAEDELRRLQGKPRLFTVNSPSYGTNSGVYRGRTRRHLTGLYAEEEC